MAALASYGRQANDDTLVHMAMRIQARAIRKAGELLQNISSAQGMRTDRLREGDRPKSPRNEAAREAGFSEHQQKQALRVANLDEDEFEQAIEGHKPATITELAERGTKSRESPFNGKEPTGRTHTTHSWGYVRAAQALAWQGAPCTGECKQPCTGFCESLACVANVALIKSSCNKAALRPFPVGGWFPRRLTAVFKLPVQVCRTDDGKLRVVLNADGRPTAELIFASLFQDVK